MRSPSGLPARPALPALCSPRATLYGRHGRSPNCTTSRARRRPDDSGRAGCRRSRAGSCSSTSRRLRAKQLRRGRAAAPRATRCRCRTRPNGSRWKKCGAAWCYYDVPPPKLAGARRRRMNERRRADRARHAAGARRPARCSCWCCSSASASSSGSRRRRRRPAGAPRWSRASTSASRTSRWPTWRRPRRAGRPISCKPRNFSRPPRVDPEDRQAQRCRGRPRGVLPAHAAVSPVLRPAVRAHLLLPFAILLFLPFLLLRLVLKVGVRARSCCRSRSWRGVLGVAIALRSPWRSRS